MKQFRFLDWHVYKDAQSLFSNVIRLVGALPKEYRYSLGEQIMRSSLSVILNIAEGSGKTSDKELNRFLGISLGSLYETLAALDTLRLNQLISKDTFRVLAESISGIAKQLGGFRKHAALRSVSSVALGTLSVVGCML